MEETPEMVPAPVAAEYTTPKPVSTTYQSNPFLVVAKGIVTILQYNPGTALVMAIVLSLIGIAGIVFFILLCLIFKGAAMLVIISILGLIAYFAFLAISAGSYLSLGSASTRQERIGVQQALKHASAKVLPLIGVSVISGLAITIGFVLLIVPGVILLGRLSLALVVMMEENLGVVASLKRSWALTRHHTIEMLGALFASSFMSGGGLIAPTVSIAPLFGRYDDLVALERSGQAKPPIHWLNYLAFLALVPLVGMAILIALFSNGTIKTANTNMMNQDQVLQQLPPSGDSNGSDPFGSGSSSDNSGFSNDNSGSLNSTDTSNW